MIGQHPPIKLVDGDRRAGLIAHSAQPAVMIDMPMRHHHALDITPAERFAPLIADLLDPGSNMVVALAQAAAGIHQRDIVAGDHNVDIRHEHLEDAHRNAVDPRAAIGLIACHRF